jgi:glycosyltransferase involved in cell wall biosynthesis
MRIAQVAPLYESVPPRYYGGTERVVSYLTEELVRQGHEVTLFASGDSDTNARLVAACRRSLRLDKRYQGQMAHHFGAVPEVMDHSHTGFVVEGLEDAVEAVRRVPELSRKRCREVFEQRFTATRMAHDYVQQFERLIARNQEEVSEAA